LEGGHVSCFIRVCCIRVCLHSKTSLGPFSLLRADFKIDNKYAAKAAERRASTIPVSSYCYMCSHTAVYLAPSYCYVMHQKLLKSVPAQYLERSPSGSRWHRSCCRQLMQQEQRYVGMSCLRIVELRDASRDEKTYSNDAHEASAMPGQGVLQECLGIVQRWLSLSSAAMALKLSGKGGFKFRGVVKPLVFFYSVRGIGTLHCLHFDICSADRQQKTATYCTHTARLPSDLHLS
jgi:hypothetical protein